MKLLLVLVSTLLLSSCASLFNPEDCRTDFRSPVPRTVLIDSTTIQVQPGKAIPVAFMRGNQTKEAVLITDTRTDTIEVRPRWSEAYYFNFATLRDRLSLRRQDPEKMEIPLDPAPYRPVHRQTSQRYRPVRGLSVCRQRLLEPPHKPPIRQCLLLGLWKGKPVGGGISGTVPGAVLPHERQDIRQPLRRRHPGLRNTDPRRDRL